MIIDQQPAMKYALEHTSMQQLVRHIYNLIKQLISKEWLSAANDRLDLNIG